MFTVTNYSLMSHDTQHSLKMLYKRNFEDIKIAKKALKICTEADKNYSRLVLELRDKSKEEIKTILESNSKMACEKLNEQEILYNHPVSPLLINGLTPFIN